MVLIDTGPLVLLIDKKHPKHQFCCQTLSDLPKPFMTTWICLAEAMYLAYRKGGWVMQNQLSKLLTEGLLVIFDIQQKDYNRLFHLMEKYRDTPMDFADATLVLAAENLKIEKIVTLDSDFYVYRINDSESFDVLRIN
jgi:uncharacterized protein